MTNRLSILQHNPTVGALERNVDAILDGVARALESGATLLVTGELALTGYPPEDLLLRPAFLDAVERQVERLLEASRGIDIVVGTPWRRAVDNAAPAAGGLFNAALWLRAGAVHAAYAKQCLPNYAVFDERRYFQPGSGAVRVEWAGRSVALSVCEDIWESEPARAARAAGADWILSLNASPWHRDKRAARREVLTARVAENRLPIVYVNLVGGQDELVFDGRSLVAQPVAPGALATPERATQDASVGEVSIRAVLPAWQEGQATLTLQPDGRFELHTDASNAAMAVPEAGSGGASDESEIWAALCTGLRDYVKKNGFQRVLLGLSGGIDSALVATLAVDALGADRVDAVMMAYRHTSALSVELARDLARRQGIGYSELPIVAVVDPFDDLLAPWFEDDAVEARARDLARENLQSRTRGTLLMALSNARGALVLACGNKSETAVGYSTLYGDMAGGFSPLKDVTKHWVYRLANWRNATSDVIPVGIIERPPSAELSPGQRDTDSLPDYDVLDALIEGLVERDSGVEELVAAGYARADVEQVLRLVRIAEYKRRQSAPGVRVTRRAFGRDRRYPITSGFTG